MVQFSVFFDSFRVRLISFPDDSSLEILKCVCFICLMGILSGRH